MSLFQTKVFNTLIQDLEWYLRTRWRSSVDGTTSKLRRTQIQTQVWWNHYHWWFHSYSCSLLFVSTILFILVVQKKEICIILCIWIWLLHWPINNVDKQSITFHLYMLFTEQCHILVKQWELWLDKDCFQRENQKKWCLT